LRYEDFSVWKTNKTQFQYQGEYQMAETDCYYYLQIAKELQQGNYDNHQEKRRIPDGVKTPIIPPLISLIAVSLSNLTGITIPNIAIFLPIFLASLLAPLIYALSLRLHFNKPAALTAALFSIISLTYVIRTRIGVFDTDCLNVVFVSLNSFLFFSFAEIKDNKRYIYFGLGLLSFFLFFIWWDTAKSVVVASALVPLSVSLIFFYKTKRNFLKYCVLVVIILVSGYFVGNEMQAYINLLFASADSDFPKNISVSELSAVNLDYFVKYTLNNTLILLGMLIGIILLCWKLKLKILFFAIPIALAIVPFFAGNRFIIFSAPILALGIGYCIQILFTFNKKLNPKFAIAITFLIAIIGIASNYKITTDGYAKSDMFENAALLTALEKHTPKGANIWTDWDLGYQIRYYLDRGTFADGEFSDGEIYYYVSFPLASNNLAVSANFMRFYNKHGVKGMKILYDAFSSKEKTFEFIKTVFSYEPSNALTWLKTSQQNNLLPKSDDLTSVEDWLSFLFPRQAEDIYVFFHYKMTQTAAWFKQGNSDLITKQTIGLPLFLSFSGLREQGSIIINNEINIDTNTGIAKYYNQYKYFQSLSTFNGTETTSKTFGAIPSAQKFVFQWIKKVGFGAAMSPEMANTTLVRLYLMQEKSPYFEPVFLNSPQYQIWKISGTAYDDDNDFQQK
jgi:asparagine N-glycosylation enzyme membrane subunit Stt3